ncbi:MAG TPA: ABC transporter substrate-binding protein [Microvirga sp.]|jgi:multiple sugar transport system substrate-binding protein
MQFWKPFAGLVLGMSLTFSAPLAAAELVINADASEPSLRKAWEGVVDQFRKENPGTDVKLNVYDRESYKRSIRNWLTAQSPDVVFWYAGTRMRQFSKPGLLEDVSEIYTPQAKQEFGPVATDLMSDAGKQYGVPHSYYQWGFFYRKDLFQKAGITEAPKTWNDFLGACEKLKASGVEPITIGSKDLWPTAGWFDYINLRTNGLKFHQELMGGTVPYTDTRVKAVFAKWNELLDKGCFMKNHASMSWQDSQAPLFQGKAGMMLMGNFITGNFPANVANDMDFFRFPEINAGVGKAEDAPMDALLVPARAKNKADAKKFLAFVMRPDVQTTLAAGTRQIPVNQKASVPDDRFLKVGQQLLSQADGLAQFFDRDTSEELATVGMKGFQEFMANPDRLDRVLEDLERTRKRVYQN